MKKTLTKSLNWSERTYSSFKGFHTHICIHTQTELLYSRLQVDNEHIDSWKIDSRQNLTVFVDDWQVDSSQVVGLQVDSWRLTSRQNLTVPFNGWQFTELNSMCHGWQVDSWQVDSWQN